MAIAKTNAHRKIGILGGSFNPAHSGHREISIAALERLGLDAVWWLVTPGNPLKDSNVYAPYEERLKMARAVSDHPDIVVSDFEKRHGLTYTVDTLEALQADNSNCVFVWLMGADGLENFHKWKDWKKIAALAPMAVFARPGYQDGALSGPAAKELAAFRLNADQAESLTSNDAPAWIYFPDTNNPISSTELRNRKILHSTTTDQSSDLTAPHGALAYFLDLHPDLGDFHADAIEGLSKKQKCISPKYFYDERGSKIFNGITEVREYYPTRTERQIFLENAQDITDAIGSGASIFEYGSGSSEKIEWLVKGLKDPMAYVAMDISRDHLIESASVMAEQLPIPVAAICADFHAPISFPEGILPQPEHWLGYFPGSTIGNMLPETAVGFLRRASDTLGENARFLIGVDLVKDKSVLEAAYDDDQGITAKFNLNLLVRMQRELGARIDLDHFEHYAFYNEQLSRIEMHLRATQPTEIVIDDHVFSFAKDETLHTENSHKFTLEKFSQLVNQTPWHVEKSWTDPKGWFAACLLSNR
ncbi:L-histidine N(alpha)-methyltransferase [Hyphococcus sp. DH-69]|uniref:L-histidine N(alpha)-methyltransferase n=1 Tax=Hyphococcus formosus TaxID=3143534 RepID=UPI00398B1540